MSKIALLLVDFQNDYFEGGKWPLHETKAAVENGAQLLRAFRDKDMPVVHVRHEFPTDDAAFFAPGSEGAQIHEVVTPADNEPTITKNQINSFRDTQLKEILDAASVDKVIIAGAMSHMCIDGVTRAANDLGYECAVAHDACATLGLEFEGVKVPPEHVHAAFMAALGFAYAKVATTDDLISELP